jgi:type I restriction enzyme S subunit
MVSGRWKKEPLASVATLQRGFDLPSRLRKPGGVPIITSSGTEDKHCEARVRGPGVVTGRYGTIGEVFFVPADFWPLNTTLYVRDFHGNDPLFISYLLRTIDFHTHSGKSGVPGVNRNDLHEIVVNLPSTKTEQEAIARALSDVDALIESLEQLIAKKRKTKQGAMQELLTGKKRLPRLGKTESKFIDTELGRLPAEWPVVEVKLVTRSHKQGYYTKDRYVDAGVKLIRITDLLNPRIDYAAMPMLRLSSNDHDLYKVGVGDFLFARSGAIGRYGIVYEDMDAVFGSYIIRFRFDPAKLNNEYFGYLYETEIVLKQLVSITQGSSNININASNIKSILIPLPNIDEQAAVATILSDMDAEIAALDAKLTKTRLVKQGMMQELLTGRIRLI